jgi:GxxExxY protein
MTENHISYKIRGCIFKVYNTLGPGLLESVYEAALEYELVNEGLKARSQVPIPVIYNDIKLDLGFRADIVVDEKVLIEIKSVEKLAEVHHKQVLTYLKITGIKLGILVNFNTEDINETIFRKVNGFVISCSSCRDLRKDPVLFSAKICDICGKTL